jgi:hypothetical protein
MTEEEFISISEECGFKIVKHGGVIYTTIGDSIYWVSYYDSGCYEVALSVSVTYDYNRNIRATGMTEKYTKYEINKEMYRERMIKLQKEIKELKIKLRKSEIEKDFVND